MVRNQFDPLSREYEPQPKDPAIKYLSTNETTPFGVLYCTAIPSAIAAELYCYPLDLCKTRMHLQGESSDKSLSKLPYRGLFATAKGIVMEEGPLKLYFGFSAMVMRHLIYTGLKMGLYDVFRTALLTKNKDGNLTLTFARGSLCAVVAGALGSTVATPAEVLKVQMQMESKRRLMGEPARVKNIFQAMAYVYKTSGIIGFYRGMVPNALRSSLVTLGDVGFYDLSKRTICELLDVEDNRLVQFAGAMSAGLVGTVLSTPADVAKSRIMNQPVDEAGRGLHYTGIVDCLSKLVKNEGVTSLYKGFLPFWLRVGPYSLIFWTTFEFIRKMSGREAY